MESSPLIKAHDHARAAAIATQTSDTTVAINEHAQAAGEFANASKTTSSHEALRTLKLLEQHHKRLSELLKLPISPPRQASSEDIPEEDEKDALAANDSKAPSSQNEQPLTRKKSSAKPPPTLSQPRYPGRNLSSSIATNLASARGIRASYSTKPLTPSVSNDQAPGSLEVHPRREGSMRSRTPDQPEQAHKPSWVPPAIQENAVSETPKTEPSSPSPSEDGFSRFYSTFGSLINRLSAPLAFTGLPLISEESTPAPAPPPPSEPPQKKSRHKPSTSSVEPDLSKIYSRATLRSLERDGNGGADSFYVVPTSGHTASYASILNHDNKEKRRIAASSHRGVGDDNNSNNSGHPHNSNEDNEDEDDFVDARESQVPAAVGMSPALRKRTGGRGRSEKELRNAVEELQVENASLKDVLDKLSKRLHAFELNSQSSHLALAQSLRLQRPGSPLSSSGVGVGVGVGVGAGPTTGAGQGEEALRRRNRELEEQMAEMVKRMNSLEKDHLKLQVTLEKYRDRWEKLKAGAKARREALDSAQEGSESKK
ncbi:hypothetical protein C7999DRAFT_34403 [Corynascus novoguineensis]|uniref:Uncharacterized protein n=1 Tax=Corynascus novoguineensis TaxID=1126955 RepID=A0AAN7CPV4_9PEZI|nr:hypothetical protein C7999DRAFT_34403 [Corynascus novoguineensis]